MAWHSIRSTALVGLSLIGLTITGLFLSPVTHRLSAAPVSHHEAMRVALRDVQAVRGHTNSITVITYSADGKLLATGGRDNKVILWDMQTGKLLHNLGAHDDGITALAFSHDGALLASGSYDKKVHIWDIKTGDLLETLTQQERITSLSFAPKGHILAVASWDNMVRLWDIPGNKKAPAEPIWTWTETATAPEVVAFSPDGKLLATGSWDRNIRLWDTRRFKVKHTLHGHNSGITRLSFSADSKTLASGSGDGAIKLWDVKEAKALRTLHGAPNYVTSTALSPDGTMVVTGQDGIGNLMVWNARDGTDKKILMAGGPIAFSPDGKTLATAHYAYIKLWNVETWNMQSIMPEPRPGSPLRQPA